ncbi:hypothetical protein L227DRAFT_521527 [Lentinus tigrinus ALCF2SS1-6]|uniref:Fungal-type protein kinase domain-containing protein n=1 Tax=Lentinus tigrinus ALCF2SS1-6 TaxID=1328759 RepID=A0A5C2SHY1_9APHY|nr:hypothetical protein L227DRAFT_521527 [Lentinus tigrinus ALCF2SS1-6]
MHADKHKNSDANRNPEVNIQQSVKDTRTHMLSDASDTSIAMRILQLLGDMVTIDLIKENMPTRERATRAQWSFASNLQIAPGQQHMRKESELIESDYSAAWHNVDRDIHLLPGHFLSLSETKYAENDKSQQKIDGAFYPDEYEDDVSDGRPNWVRMGLPVEFKRGGTGLDPFDDRPGYKFEPDADKRKEVRGQVMSYAEHVFGDQHRTAVYMLFVNGPLFRVMRWDHSGVIVSEPIDYLHSVDGTTCLLTFLNCYAAVSLAGRGIDTTAVPLSEDSCGWQRMDVVAGGSEHDLDYDQHIIEDDSKLHDAFVDPSKGSVSLGTDDCVLHQDPTTRCTRPTTCHRSYPTDVVPEFTHARKYFQDSISGGHPRYMIKVGDMTLLVGKPMFTASGLIGRGTRGFVALDWQSQRLVFLKDAWRPYYEGMQEEGEILEKLNEAGVRNVPTVLAHGDVEGQETEASNYSPLTGPKRVRPYDAWPVQNDLAARVKEMKLKSSKKAMPASVAAPDVEDNTLAEVLATHASVTAQTGPAGYPTGPVFKPPLPSQGAGPSAEYVARLIPSSAAGSASSTSGSSYDGEAPSTNDSTQSEDVSGAAAGVKRSAEEMEKQEAGAGLRHLIHFRVVMKEICLGAMAFKNSRQWVAIILDSLVAHSQAYDRCGYIHRDVSAGNILILPTIRRQGDKRVVYWQGILADWELAKHKDINYAREPDRTGTWHYMSWNLLSYPGDSVSIADELEAFVHVLIYGCVRFIHHNFKNIDGFMESYFNGFSLNGEREFACPPVKRLCLVAGALTDGDGPILFVTADGSIEHPLNNLIKTLLCLFRARYRVLLWKKIHAPETPRRQQSAPSGNAATTNTSLPDPPLFDPDLPDEWEDAPPAGEAVSEDMNVDNTEQLENPPHEEKKDRDSQLVTDVEQRPTPEMERIAASLQSHKTIGRILGQYLRRDTPPEGMKKPVVWPTNDKGPDRLDGYVPTDRTAATQKPSKKARTKTDTKPAQAEPSTSGSKTTRLTRQPSSRQVVAPSDRTTRSKDGTLPKRGQDLPQPAPSTRAITRQGSGRGRGRGRGTGTVTRAASSSAPAAGPSNSRTTQAATVTRTRSQTNLQDGRVSRSSSKRGGKGKAPARG